MRKLLSGVLAIAFLVLLFVGCSEQMDVAAPVDSDTSLALLVSRNAENGNLSVKDGDGQVYDIDFLRRVLDGEVDAQIILEQPSPEKLMQAAPPRRPISIYIANIMPWRSNGGVSMQPTWDGYIVGLDYQGALVLADWTIQEYKRQSGRSWPYSKRSRRSIANEIQVHCWLIFTPLWRRAFPIDMGFSERIWG